MKKENAKLISMLQKAYAGELAAYLAYEGHALSVKDPIVSAEIRQIQADELKHMGKVKEILKSLHSEPSKMRNVLFWCIGRTVSALCYVTGYLLPMKVAGMIETVGVNAYEEMAEEAYKLGHYGIHVKLIVMMVQEQEHEEYFRSVQ